MHIFVIWNDAGVYQQKGKTKILTFIQTYWITLRLEQIQCQTKTNVFCSAGKEFLQFFFFFSCNPQYLSFHLLQWWKQFITQPGSGIITTQIRVVACRYWSWKTFFFFKVWEKCKCDYLILSRITKTQCFYCILMFRFGGKLLIVGREDNSYLEQNSNILKFFMKATGAQLQGNVPGAICSCRSWKPEVCECRRNAHG